MPRRDKSVTKTRLKPVQSRSYETSRAIREAFVRLLLEKPYEQVTIREIVLVAGVGLGTFYDYFDSKEALARACVRLRTRELLLALRRQRAVLSQYDLASGIAAAVEAQAKIFEAAPREWSQHFLLERHKSDRKYYLSGYGMFLAEWRDLIEGAADWPEETSGAAAAMQIFTLHYGGYAHALISEIPASELREMRTQMSRVALVCVLALRDQNATN